MNLKELKNYLIAAEKEGSLNMELPVYITDPTTGSNLQAAPPSLYDENYPHSKTNPLTLEIETCDTAVTEDLLQENASAHNFTHRLTLQQNAQVNDLIRHFETSRIYTAAEKQFAYQHKLEQILDPDDVFEVYTNTRARFMNGLG